MPTFSVPGGTYTSVQTVAISDMTPGAAIYYTTDGSVPTAASSLYSGPITVSSTETVEAIAVATGYFPSAPGSAAYTINLPPPTFAFSVAPASVTVNPGGQGTATLTITPQNGFNSAVSFACSGLPARATCSFNPASVSPTSATNVTVTINAPARASAIRPGMRPLEPVAALACGVWLVCRRKRLGQGCWPAWAIALGCLVLVSACGGGSSTPTPTTSTVTVAATSGSIQQTATIMLTVN
jgi:hypothetical protein